MDYMARWLALKFMPKEKAKHFHNADLGERAYSEGTKSKEAFAMRFPIFDEGKAAEHGLDYGTAVDEKTSKEMAHATSQVAAAPSKAEQAKLQGFTGSLCSGCGSFKMKRNGSCEVCLDCGATSGCS